MRSHTLFVALLLSHLHVPALADAARAALIDSYLGEYSLVKECDLSYYGIGRPRDFTRIHECYGNDPVMEILSYANGHGVARDVKRAITLATALDHFMKDEILRDLKKLQDATEKYELYPCDYAFSTPGLSFCVKLSRRQAELRIYDLGMVYRDHPDTGVRGAWQRVDRAIKDFARSERSYVYDSLEGGSMQRYGPGAVEATILEKHGECLERLGNYAPHEAGQDTDLLSADRELNETYAGVLEQQDNVALRRKRIQAQRKWIEYRDAMVALVKAIDDADHPAEKTVRDVKIWLTRQRISTL